MTHGSSLLPVPFLLLALGVAVAGCAGRTHGPTTPGAEPEETEDMAGLRIRSGEGPGTVYSDEDLFNQARALAREGNCPDAVLRYEQLVTEFANSRLAAAALYNAALCLMRLDDHAGAAERYARLVRDYPGSSDVRAARFQLALLYERLAQWDALVAIADELLADTALDVDDRVEALARRAQGLFGQGERTAAASQARDTLRYVSTRREGSEVRGFYFVAAANFVLAETVRLNFDEAPIPPGDIATQRRALDVRAAHLLEAQRLYFDTMRWSEPFWTAAAGYQIGSLYDRFFQSILAAPVPPASEPLEGAELADYEQTYREALTQYVEPLLRHSIRYWELTLQMIERTGVDTEWRARIEADLTRVRQQLGTLLGP
ncbi:MAG: tetratricopeptide repeat protein [Sandaracinaceae bacterium]|nr:tetratricopeptide repeat protein [Sandaracinaceae bacterium]